MTIFNYIIKDFFKYVVGIVALSMFLFVMFDFIHKTTKYFTVHNPETKYVIQFYLYQLPTLMVQGLPIASLLASVVAMVLLSRTNEITAMRAAGMGPLQIAAPIVIGGLILSMTSLIVGEFVAPKTSQKMRYVQQVLIEKRNPTEMQAGTQWLRKNNRLYHFDDFDPLSKKMAGIRIIETGLNFRPKKTVEAASATYNHDTGFWKLAGVRVLHFNPNGTLAFTEKKEALSAFIPVEPQKLKRERRKPNELSIFELNDVIAKGTESGADVSAYTVEMHIKFAFHFAAVVVCMIGLKFGYRSERTVETARGVLLAIAIGISYWFILSSGKALAKRGTIPPPVGAWLANVVIFGIGSFELWRTRQSN